MHFLFLGSDGRDNAAIGYLVVAGDSIFVDEEDGVCYVGNLITNAILYELA
jgi:hypothetical protein